MVRAVRSPALRTPAPSPTPPSTVEGSTMAPVIPIAMKLSSEGRSQVTAWAPLRSAVTTMRVASGEGVTVTNRCVMPSEARHSSEPSD